MFKKVTRFLELLAHLPYFPRKPDINIPDYYGTHPDWITMLSTRFNKPGMRILEIGSRNVTGANLRNRFDQADYVGFDIYPGENVDVVGDAHKLSTYFDPEEKFDLIFSSAVFEHLYAPWVAAQGMASLLKVGGQIFVETHFSWRAHERPWNFFQFSDMGLRALFNEGLGFRVLDCGMKNPMIGFYTRLADKNLRYKKVKELYCHSSILVEKMDERKDFRWEDMSVNEIVGETRYPSPKTLKI
ncbi:MAG: methyltransferase domain-containing protein [Verrucomicrobia bacterium]|nr:methyltransferase domain-containing protein [Verrucomicrobiota bacterium]